MINIFSDLTRCHGLARELLSRDDDFITILIGDREYVIKGIKKVRTCANKDDSSVHTALVADELSGCIIR